MEKINKLAEKIIGQIKKEGIKPTSRWKFIVQDSFFWLAFTLSVIVGAMVVSIILNTLLNNDWDLYMELSGDLTQFIVITLPYFWLVLLGGLMVVAYLNIKHTKKAYRFNLRIIIGGVVLSSCLLGLTFYNLGLASSLDRGLIQKLPPRFHQMVDSRLGVWQKPEIGFLIGEIQNINGKELGLKDFEGNFWQVVLELEEFDLINVLLKINDKVRLMGELTPEKCEKCFSAVIIRPLNQVKGMMHDQLDKVSRRDLPGMMKMKKILD